MGNEGNRSEGKRNVRLNGVDDGWEGRRGAVQDALVPAQTDGWMVGGGLGVIPLRISQNDVQH